MGYQFSRTLSQNIMRYLYDPILGTDGTSPSPLGTSFSLHISRCSLTEKNAFRWLVARSTEHSVSSVCGFTLDDFRGRVLESFAGSDFLDLPHAARDQIRG